MSKINNRRAFTTNLDADLMEKFKEYCFYQRKHQNEVIEELIRDKLVEEDALNVNSDKGV
jgi:metal-responsive CopG/Arc/MetJ family transcriptional regulator